jgi:transcriptional regulator with XRE-family HTH domain
MVYLETKGVVAVISRLSMFRFKPNGERLRQGELAKEIGCSREWIRRAEKGRLGRTAELMLRLSHYLDRDLREIFICEPTEAEEARRRGGG